MKKNYQKPAISVIELDAQSIIAQSLQYRSTLFSTNDNSEVSVTYTGINTQGIGDGGFLNSK
ncbi:MAG: hypothetical protein K6E73_02830 [Bacteroidales bacterium]|nr:hypothetical protein [Bacteroidales bacterium]